MKKLPDFYPEGVFFFVVVVGAYQNFYGMFLYEFLIDHVTA